MKASPRIDANAGDRRTSKACRHDVSMHELAPSDDLIETDRGNRAQKSKT